MVSSIMVVLGVVSFLIVLFFLMWGWDLEYGPHVATLVGVAIFVLLRKINFLDLVTQFL